MTSAEIEPAAALFTGMGVSIEALVDGCGQPVVMVPSLGRSAEDYSDLADRLVSAGYRAVRVRPRGLGASRGPDGPLTLWDLAEDVALVIRELGGPAVVIGHAFGQRVVRALAVRHPELVKGIVMLAAGGKVPPSAEAKRSLDCCFSPVESADHHLECVRHAFFADGNDPSPWQGGWHVDLARAQDAADNATPSSAWWHAGETRLLVVQGLQDIIAVPENGRLLKSEFGDRVTLVEFDGAGHALLPEKPAEIASTILSFMAAL